jgi:hypothetical protein
MIKETEDFSMRVTERANTNIEELRRHISFDTLFHKNSFFITLEKDAYESYRTVFHKF